ncbi:hypothetical protein Tco_1496553 [Tanacetum coccineum]
MALPPREQRHRFLRYEGLEYTDSDIADFESRMAMEHRDEAGVVVFTIRLGVGCMFQLGGARRRLSWRQFILALRLHTREEMESPSFARRFAAGRKSGVHIYGGQFVARMAEHFRLLTTEILGGLTVISLELPIIDMAELVRLQICMQFDDTWAFVAMGPERQPDATASAPAVAEDAPTVDEGDQAVSAPVQAPPPLPPAAKTVPQRLGRLEEDVQGLRRDVRSLRGLTFDETFRGSSPLAFQRRTRQRTDGASTSAAQQDPQQLDP